MAVPVFLALAALIMAKLNGESQIWFQDIPFKDLTETVEKP
jgi:hypothetical protein